MRPFFFEVDLFCFVGEYLREIPFDTLGERNCDLFELLLLLLSSLEIFRLAFIN